jgi:diguanylate cyclase
MWLDLAIAMSAGGGGLVCGWVLYAMGGFGNHKFIKEARAHIDRGRDTQTAESDRLREVAERLREDAYSIVADVDAHQTKVQAVSKTLIERCGSSPQLVSDAVGELIEANESMQAQLRKAQERIQVQTAQIESAERRAHTDALTLIPNRAAFDKHIASRHSIGHREAGTLAIMDVDHFKQFNDVYGHRAGDEVLREVARTLHARLQSHGLVARFGGEEFAVILDGYPIAIAMDLVESARRAIGEREIVFEDKRLRVAASVGIAELLKDESVDSWLQRADNGLYRSKETGRDCGHWMNNDEPIRIETPHPNRDSAAGPESPRADSTDATHGTVNDDSQWQREPVQGELLSALEEVPTRDDLAAGFAEICGRTQSSVALYVMAIQCRSAVNNATIRSLLQIVRATLRSVDRMGRDEDSTLLVCLPSVDAKSASEQAYQIVRAAESIGLKGIDGCETRVSVGIIEANPDHNFDDIVSRATRLLQQAQVSGQAPVCLEGQRAMS